MGGGIKRRGFKVNLGEVHFAKQSGSSTTKNSSGFFLKGRIRWSFLKVGDGFSAWLDG
jgi:hypothetical protein